jgi:hypothetical protein
MLFAELGPTDMAARVMDATRRLLWPIGGSTLGE